MMDTLKPYPGYNDSGLPWLGSIPQHWEVRRNGRLFMQRNSTGYGHLPILEVSLKTGVRVRNMDSLKRKQVISDRNKYKRAAKGDIAYNMMRMWQGAVGVAPVDGLVSPAYVVVRPRPEVEPRYFSYLFRTDIYKEEVDGFSRGIVKDRNRLYWEDFKRIPSCFPSLAEQKIIADYLDINAVKVRRFIRNRRRLIEVLNEQKQAIINQAVTRGLDPSVRLKPSGIDWLGDIPKHWEVISLRQLGRFSKGSGGSREDDVAEGVPCIRYGHLYMYFNFTVSAVRTYLSEKRACDYARIKYGDILFTASGEDMNEIGKSVVNLIEEEVCCGGDVIILRPQKGAHAPFLGYASDAWHARCQKARLGRGTTVKHIYGDQLKKVCIVVPPMDEQVAIADHIRLATSEATSLIDRAQREIDLIREYRIRLISDVVTGKIDVRHMAPHPGDEDLEETFEALEPLEDAMADVEMDEEEDVNESD